MPNMVTQICKSMTTGSMMEKKEKGKVKLIFPPKFKGSKMSFHLVSCI
jgi:hypothetical protein